MKLLFLILYAQIIKSKDPCFDSPSSDECKKFKENNPFFGFISSTASTVISTVTNIKDPATVGIFIILSTRLESYKKQEKMY